MLRDGRTYQQRRLGPDQSGGRRGTAVVRGRRAGLHRRRRLDVLLLTDGSAPASLKERGRRSAAGVDHFCCVNSRRRQREPSLSSALTCLLSPASPRRASRGRARGPTAEGARWTTRPSNHPTTARGSWTTTHQTRPVDWFSRSALEAGFPRGFAEGLARYGLLLGRYDVAVIGGFMYVKLVPFGAGGTATPEQMQARVATSARAFAERFWREDLAQWDEVVKPGAIAAHLAVQAVDPAALSDDELAEHVDRCRDHLEASIELHHRYSAPSSMATGDFLAGAMEWTGATRGRADGSPAGHVGHLHRVRRRPSWTRWPMPSPPPTRRGRPSRRRATPAPCSRRSRPTSMPVPRRGPTSTRSVPVDRLRRRGAVGRRAARHAARRDPLSCRPPQGRGRATTGTPPCQAIRARVPAEHLGEFDDRLHEARLANRLRDERATYSDGWAVGLARRPCSRPAAGSPRAGRLADPEHAVDADAVRARGAAARSSRPERGRGRRARSGGGPRGPSTTPRPSSGATGADRRRWRRCRSPRGGPPSR